MRTQGSYPFRRTADSSAHNTGVSGSAQPGHEEIQGARKELTLETSAYQPAISTHLLFNYAVLTCFSIKRYPINSSNLRLHLHLVARQRNCSLDSHLKRIVLRGTSESNTGNFDTLFDKTQNGFICADPGAVKDQRTGTLPEAAFRSVPPF